MSTVDHDRNRDEGHADESPVGSDVEYEEVEEEEEVEDEEEEEEEEEVKSAPQTPKKVGKVAPSHQVKNMKHSSPESVKKGASLTPAKNPFTSLGSWTPSTFNEITINFPILGAKNETTNDLTRESRPENRYWKGNVTFSYATYSSETIKIDNVHIPYHNGRNYGEGFVYVCLPSFMADRFAEVGKARRPTVSNETSLRPDNNRWWKIVNNVTDKIGTIDKTSNKFHSKSLSTIFEGTGKGIKVNLVCKFLVKANTEEKSPLKATVPQRIVLEIERGYIEETDVDVQPPTKIPKNKPRAEPLASKKDVASDALMKRLAELGL